MKICNRDYAQNSMYTVTKLNGVPCCPLCEKPTVCHNTTVGQRALFWSLSDDTGISSKAIAKYMAGSITNNMMPPSDADDRGRCIRLLELIPEWIVRLPEMVKFDAQSEEGIVINNSGIGSYSNSWAKQIPLIRQEGKL